MAGICTAEERTMEEAAEVAARFTNNQPTLRAAHRSARKAQNMHLAHTCRKIGSTAPAYYVFNQENNAGYVIVSGDDLAADVLVYSEQGHFDTTRINPNFRFWLRRMQEEMSIIDETNAAPKTATQVTAISPLLTNQDGTEITWYQEAPYYNLCPMDERDNTRCLTGCVATAAAQIMYKWRYPAKGTGSHSYTWYDCLDNNCRDYKDTTLSKDFSKVTFDWDNMLPAYDGVSATPAQKNAVATLMYCCGIACDMEYGGDENGGSGAWTDDIGYGMKTYFGYRVSKFITTYSKSEYQNAKGQLTDLDTEWSLSTSKFATYFNTELEAGRPILMGGEDSDGGGHEFVCDGRNSSGYFHINWGWEGEGNNYCLLTSLKPSGVSYNFSSDIDALIGLEPATRDTVHVTSVSVAPTTATLKIKEKTTLTATVLPNNATFKDVTWKSNQTSVATVSAAGVVEGVSSGSATITATTVDGGFIANCAITVTKDTIAYTDCDSYEYTFTSTSNVTTGSNDLGDYTWNISLQAGSVQGFDTQSGRGWQFGSKKNPCGQVSFTTTDEQDCMVNNITVNTAMGSSGAGNIAIYIGGTQVGTTQAISTISTDYSFSNTKSLQGPLEIRFTDLTKALYVLTININTGVGPTPTPTDTIYVTPSEAVEIGKKLTANTSSSPQMYAVTGIVSYAGTVKSGTQTFWMDDEDGEEQLFEAYNANLKNTTAVAVGDKVMVYGYIYHYVNSKKNHIYEINAGNAYKLNTTDVEEITTDTKVEVVKWIQNGQLIILRNNHLYNAQGQLLR